MLRKKHIAGLLAATALASAASAPVKAQSIEELKAQLEALSKRIEELEKKQEKAPKVKKADPAFSLGTDDGLFEFNIRGRVLADAGWSSDSDGTMNKDTTELRASRIGVEGKAWKNVKYKFEADFAGNDVEVKDAFMQYKSSMGSWTFGQFKTPNSLEEMESSLNTNFVERAAFTDAFALARMIGVGYGNGGDNWTFNAGVYRGSNDGSVDNEGQVFAARATYGGEFDGGNWLLGGSVRFRDVGGDGDLLRYRQKAYLHTADRLLATSRIADKDAFYGLEAAVQYGSLNVTAEWAGLNANNAGAGGRDAFFYGGYVEAAWFITGETKPLNLSKGVWNRPKIKSPLHEGGMGAWQVAGRFDRVDLTADGVYGGEQDTYTLGVNWYLNRHTRFLANYAHVSIDKAFDVSANGADGKNSADTLGLRFQVDW
ncbi:MAG: hypothetical protein HWE08_08870 [Alphaproteobacteria bacterium]|nr:hypothetical protein [Alphaproteobacteria bacterium]